MPEDRERQARFVRALKEARVSRKLTQDDLARAIGVTLGAVKVWETLSERWSRPAPENLFEIERVLDLQPGNLSRHFGFIPSTLEGDPRSGRRRRQIDCVAAIQNDPLLSPRERAALLAMYRELVRDKEHQRKRVDLAS